MPKVSLEEILRRKERIRSKLESELNRREIKRAERDDHARREPRPCGLTIHPARGCSFGCVYCYVPDMGLGGGVRTNPLSSLELVYALALNPYVLPGKGGTFLAFGSVTEPFLPNVAGRTIEYLRAVREHLGNPTQFSTKAYIGGELSRVIADADPSVSALVTLVGLEGTERLEPGAPSSELRLESIRNLSDAGIHVALFLRPMIPGLSDADAPELMRRAAESGARGVVLGTLRVTPRILDALASLGIRGLPERLPMRSRRGRDQITVPMPELKAALRRIAEEAGLRVYPAACSANAEAHGFGCVMCDMGPCPGPMPDYDLEEFEWALSNLLGVEAKLRRASGFIVAEVKGGGREARLVRHLVSTASRRKVIVRRTK